MMSFLAGYTRPFHGQPGRCSSGLLRCHSWRAALDPSMVNLEGVLVYYNVISALIMWREGGQQRRRPHFVDDMPAENDDDELIDSLLGHCALDQKNSWTVKTHHKLELIAVIDNFEHYYSTACTFEVNILISTTWYQLAYSYNLRLATMGYWLEVIWFLKWMGHTTFEKLNKLLGNCFMTMRSRFENLHPLLSDMDFICLTNET